MPADDRGFPASAMAKDHAGDWRNSERIHEWATQLARELPAAVPGKAVDHIARSLWRLVTHGVVGWALCGAIMVALLAVASSSTALAVHAVAAPLVFVIVSRHYFSPHGAREPLLVAAVFTALVVALDLVIVAGLVQGSIAMFKSFFGTWLPFILIFAATYFTGVVMSTLPWPRPETEARQT